MQEIPPTELRMAKYVRWYTPKKTTTIQREEVDYFVGSKAVDTLLESKYGKKCKKENPRFKTREDCMNFLQIMIDNKMFYRGEKVLKEEKKEDSKKKPVSGDDAAVKKKKEETGNTKKGGEDKKKKRRYMINYHEQQKMVDSNDIYVWVFDPVQPKKMFYGGLMLIGVVMATLFPLWPNFLRVGVYYLSVAAGCFVACVLLTGLLRSIFFFIVWMVSMGKYHIWFLPNLLADVGFFESFKPLYTIEVHSKETENASTEDEEDGAGRVEGEENTMEESPRESPIPDDQQSVAPMTSGDEDEDYDDMNDDDEEADGQRSGDSSEFEIINDVSSSSNKKND